MSKPSAIDKRKTPQKKEELATHNRIAEPLLMDRVK